MICIVACLAAHALLTNAVLTAPSPVQPAFGNTIVSTYPDGRKAKLWLHRRRARDQGPARRQVQRPLERPGRQTLS